VHPSVLEIFEQLPPEVLEEICLHGCGRNNKGCVLFPNQHNIKKVSTEKLFANRIQWNSLKLKSLVFDDIKGFEYILTGQDQMKSLRVHNLNQISLKAICNELTSLVDVYMYNVPVDRNEARHFKLWKLRNLKTLRIVAMC
jgi:hypothetical protein